MGEQLIILWFGFWVIAIGGLFLMGIVAVIQNFVIEIEKWIKKEPYKPRGVRRAYE